MSSLVRIAGALNAADEMHQFGLILPVVVGSQVSGLTSKPVTALVDTGAHRSALDKALASSLCIEPFGSEPLDVVGGIAREVGLSSCSIGFQGGVVVKLGEVAIDDLPVFCPVIIGRDILGIGQLIVDFTQGSWVLQLDASRIDSLQ